MELEIKHTNVLTRNNVALNNNDIRFIVNQGGSRSSKTYSLCQLMIIYCLQNKNKTVSIVRKSFPSLRATIYRDLIEILNTLNIYNEKNHNKTENIYKFPNGSKIEFFSLDDSQKIRGRKRDILLCNEANELEYEEFMQLNMRTTSKVFADFNPSDTEHWLYDLIQREDSTMIHSTYKDNTFLEQSIVKEIEQLIKVDQDFYNIYALGLPSKNNHTIYNHQQFFSDYPENISSTLLSLDFGYVDPNALVRLDFIDNKVYAKELLYESYMTTTELIIRVKKILEDEQLPLSTLIVCDYARPEIISEMNQNGLNCVNAIKNIKEGIDAVKSKELYIYDYSLNFKKELKNYKWKMRGEVLLDEPVDKWNHILDGLRYGILYYKRNIGGVSADSWEFFTFNI